MIPPLIVYDIEHYGLLHPLHILIAELFMFGFIREHRRVMRPLPELIAVGHPVPVEFETRDEYHLEIRAQLRNVPFIGIAPRRRVGVQLCLHDALYHLADLPADVLALQGQQPLGVYDFPLLVHDIVVFEQMLPDREVVGLDALLGPPDGLGDERMLDHVAFPQTHAGDHAGVAIGAEEPHEIVLEREIEPGRTRVSLAAAPAAELAVDPARLVPLGSDDMEPAGHLLVAGIADVGILGAASAVPARRAFVAAPVALDDAGFQLDIGSPARHVGGDRDGLRLAGPRDYLGLLLMVLGVQYGMLYALALEKPAQGFRDLDAHRADQHRPAELVHPFDLVYNGIVLVPLGQVDDVFVIGSPDRFVGGHHDDVELVYLVELARLGLGCSGHPGELLIQAEVVLNGDGGMGLRLALNCDALLGLEGLVQPVTVAPPGHEPPGKGVDDHHLAVLDDVIDVLLEQRVGLEELLYIVQPLAPLGIVRLKPLAQENLQRRDYTLLLLGPLLEELVDLRGREARRALGLDLLEQHFP